MRYPRYESYKDSGVEWLGEVPAHWEIKRLKNIVTHPLMYGANESALYADKQHPRFVRITDVNSDGTLRDDTFRSLPEHLAKPYMLKEGDILLARSGATVGKSFIYSRSWGDCCFAGYLIKASIRKEEVSPNWVYRFTQTSYYWEWIQSIQIQATIQNVSAEKYNNFFLCFPPLEEQQQIAAFLDKETAKIDTLIEKQQRLIKLLKEKRQAVISHAVTKGLNPDVKMKDSGVEWLGEVPEHWEVLRNRRVIKTIEQGWSPQADNRPPSVDEWGVTKLSSVKQGKFNPKKSKTLFPDDDPSNRIMVKEGDFLITRANTPQLVGDVCVVPTLQYKKLLLCDLIYRVTFSASIEPKFLSAFFLSVSGRTQVKMDARGTSMSMAKISQGHIKDWLVPVPPIEEQIGIVDYLNSQTKKIAQTIDAAKRANNLLKERRTALISAAVTGKIDVRKGL